MPGNYYSAHATVALSGGAAATMEAYITAPSTGNIRLLGVQVAGNFDSTAGDDPIVARLVRATSVSGGTAITPSEHDTNGPASQATVHMDSVTATEVANSCVWDTYINPKDFFRPGVTIAASESWALELDPGAEARQVKIEFWWEE